MMADSRRYPKLEYSDTAPGSASRGSVTWQRIISSIVGLLFSPNCLITFLVEKRGSP